MVCFCRNINSSAEPRNSTERHLETISLHASKQEASLTLEEGEYTKSK